MPSLNCPLSQAFSPNPNDHPFSCRCIELSCPSARPWVIGQPDPEWCISRRSERSAGAVKSCQGTNTASLAEGESWPTVHEKRINQSTRYFGKVSIKLWAYRGTKGLTTDKKTKRPGNNWKWKIKKSQKIIFWEKHNMCLSQ